MSEVLTASEADDVAQRIALVVSSCDDFCDTWKPFAHFFAKFWPDCPFKSYLLINELPVIADKIEPFHVGPDRGWASNFRYLLERIPFKYILYLQDDYFIERPVDTATVLEDCAWCLQNDADSLCFSGYPQPQPGYQPVTDRFGKAPLDSDGRTRCQFAFWKKSALMNVLREGETAWEMESRGSPRTRDMNILVYARGSESPMKYLASAIVRGLWVPEAIEMCRADGAPIRPRLRGIYRPGGKAKKLRRTLSRIALRSWITLRGRRAIDLRGA